MRKIILWIVAIATVVLVTTRTAEIAALTQTVRGGSALFLSLAVLLQLARHSMSALMYSQAFRTVGEEIPARAFLPVVFGGVFLNTIMPTGGTAGSFLTLDEARKRGVSMGHATSAMILSQIGYFAGVVSVIIVGFVILAVTGMITAREIGAALVILAILGVFSGSLIIARTRPLTLQRMLMRVESLVNRVLERFGREPRAPWASDVSAQFTDAAAAVADDPKSVAKVVARSALGHALDAATFAAVGLAFGVTHFVPLVGGYVLAILIQMVSLVPQGVGIVEAGVAIMLTSYGIPGSVATAISLVYRGFVFWIPVAIGSVMIRRIGALRTQDREMKQGTRVFMGRVAAFLTAAIGLMMIAGSIFPPAPPGLEDITAWLPPSPPLATHAVVLAGIGLFIVARELYRRRRSAWAAAIVLLVASSIAMVFSGSTWQSVAAPLVLALWLWTERSVFDTMAVKVGAIHWLWAILVAIFVTMAYGVLGFWALDHQFEVVHGLPGAFRQTVAMFFSFLNTGVIPRSGHGEWFASSVQVVGVTSLAVAIFSIVDSERLHLVDRAIDRIGRWLARPIRALGIGRDRP